jgi:hypothetical protein
MAELDVAEVVVVGAETRFADVQAVADTGSRR